MDIEDTLNSWTKPSSNSEQDKQERAERMIRQAVSSHEGFSNCCLDIYAKGSYANNTNVRADSDVDIAVECTEVMYWEEESPGSESNHGNPYTGIWTPSKLRAELILALKAKFPEQVDTSGSTAIQINSNAARVDADVVPCFSYCYYLASGEKRRGTKIFTTSGKSIVNYPAQQLKNGRAKNNRTSYAYKKAARILKRVENAMVSDKIYQELPSYFVECLAYNCTDAVFKSRTWTQVVKDMLETIYENLQGAEPSEDSARWLESNECFYLFHAGQDWTRHNGKEFARAAWSYLGYDA